jgi:hypothetical protein
MKMSATATASTNGKPQRKQLADQLDRLDTIIDALAVALPGAVADASREGTRAAVKDAIIEILTNPELRALLVPAALATQPVPISAPEPTPPPSPEPKPSLLSRLKNAASAATSAVVNTATKAKEAVVGRCRVIRDAVAIMGQAVGERLPARKMSLVALGAGVAVGVACYVMPHTMAAVVGAAGAVVAAVSVQVGGWLKRAACRFGFVS